MEARRKRVGCCRTLVPTLDDLPDADLGNEWLSSVVVTVSAPRPE